MKESQEQNQMNIISRDYKCPCGKTYLSYPALFTHIKQKHNGKAPGPIEKPKSDSRPRGRPPKEKNCPSQNGYKGYISNRDTLSSLPSESTQNLTYRSEFQKIFYYLKQIMFPEEISALIWEQVYSFKRFEEYIDEKSSSFSNFQNKQATIGIGLSEFLKDVSFNTQSWRFQQILILFMLLLQYALDESNNPRLIQNASIDFLVEFMNPFMNSHIEDYSQYLGISRLWILQNQHMRLIFLCFYNWLKWKQYTSFCITLID